MFDYLTNEKVKKKNTVAKMVLIELPLCFKNDINNKDGVQINRTSLSIDYCFIVF